MTGEAKHVGLRVSVAVLAFLAWFGTVVVGLGVLAIVSFLGDGYCDRLDGPSNPNLGRLTWSVLPPGPRCTWTEEENRFDAVEEPGPVYSIWAAAVVGLGGLTVGAILRLPSRPPGAERSNL